MLADTGLHYQQNKAKFAYRRMVKPSISIILDSSKEEVFAVLNLIKMVERVENAVGKEEMARCEQFLLFPQGFQKTCIIDT